MTVSSSSPVVGWAEQAKARSEAATEGPWLAANEKTGRRGVALVGVEALRGGGEAGCIAVFAGGGDLWKTRRMGPRSRQRNRHRIVLGFDTRAYFEDMPAKCASNGTHSLVQRSVGPWIPVNQGGEE